MSTRSPARHHHLRTVASSVGLIALVLCSPAAAPAAAATDAVSNQLIVGFDKKVSSSASKQAIDHAGGRLLRRLKSVNGTVVQPGAKGLALDTLARRLRGARGVAYA